MATPEQIAAASREARRRVLTILDELDTLRVPITTALSLIDTYPSSIGDGMPRGTAALTAVERAADARIRIARHLDNILDSLLSLTATNDRHGYIGLLATLEGQTRELRPLVTRRPERDPDAIKVHRCSGGQTAEWDRKGGIEWGDATCTEKIHARGLCNAHYVAARRYCLAHGIEWLDRTPTEV